MKSLSIVLALIIALSFSLLVAGNVLAGGGQVMGENGQGEVNQVQIQDPPPFQP